MRVALVVWLVYATPHSLYHPGEVGAMPLLDDMLNAAGLGLAVLPLALLYATRRSCTQITGYGRGPKPQGKPDASKPPSRPSGRSLQRRSPLLVRAAKRTLISTSLRHLHGTRWFGPWALELPAVEMSEPFVATDTPISSGSPAVPGRSSCRTPATRVTTPLISLPTPHAPCRTLAGLALAVRVPPQHPICSGRANRPSRRRPGGQERSQLSSPRRTRAGLPGAAAKVFLLLCRQNLREVTICT